MKNLSIMKPVAMLAALMVLASSAWALDLPVKRVKGKQYYYHKVKKGESLYGISKQLDIPVDQIIKENPGVADGVKKGDLLVFPFDEYYTEEVQVEETFADTLAAEPVQVEPAAPVVALMLPFGLNVDKESRHNTLALDFYKGVLIAADSLSSRAGKVDIVVHDTDGLSSEELAALVSSDSMLCRASVIVAPDNEAALAAIAGAASATGAYVLNVFNTRDSAYTTTPRLMQANLPQKQMYTLAVDAMMADFEGFRPVILRNKAGRNDREAFTAYLTERYRTAGVEPILIEYDTNLVSADIEHLTTADGEKYLMVPSDGSVTEFNRFAYVLRTFRDRVKADSASGADVEVFGYPDWTAFRGEALDLLHRLGATVYSRFFDDFNGFSARTIDEDFRRWFGTPMVESVPVYGILGYDTASYLIRNIRTHSGVFDPAPAVPFSGIQSTFDFVSAGEGYVNNSLYIITFGAGGRLSARIQ
ncbi:MAG: LysM peptidoglycan-binding domain-containing protein [Muribaculaceae bacterium]|nr:LysM peptidoglycan-binding domain-containing protein [Muribaculaceae bacterium]